MEDVIIPQRLVALFTLSNDMDENTTGAFVAMGIALAIFAVVIFTLPMPPKRRRH